MILRFIAKNGLFLVLAGLVGLPVISGAQSITYSQKVQADTFVSSGDPNSNFGIQGAVEIAAPTLTQPRTQMALLRFDTSGLKANFDADYGAGNWIVTAATLTLYSSVAIAGQQPNNTRFNRIAAGAFELDLLSNNDWNEMGITWNSLPDILPGPGNANTLTPLGTFFWDAQGEANSVWTLGANSELAARIYQGDLVTIFGQPGANSTVGYLANTLNFNPGFLNVTATLVPEPSATALLASFICATGCWCFSRRRKRS